VRQLVRDVREIRARRADPTGALDRLLQIEVRRVRPATQRM
jgi:hypothetical protein